VILGHAISGVDLHAGEVGAEPVAELARLGAVEGSWVARAVAGGSRSAGISGLPRPGAVGAVGP